MKPSGNLPKRAIGKSNFIDLSLLPKETMREEYRRYFLYRGGQVSLNTICHEKAYYHQVCKALQLRKNIPDSFLGWQPSKWIELLKIWMLQNGIPLYEEKESVYGTRNRAGCKGDSAPETLPAVHPAGGYAAGTGQGYMGSEKTRISLLKKIRFIKRKHWILPESCRKV